VRRPAPGRVPVRERPAQQRRRHDRRDDGHEDDRRVRRVGQHAQREADVRDDQFQRAPGVEAGTHPDRLEPTEAGEGRHPGAPEELPGCGDGERDGREAVDGRIDERGQVRPEPCRSEEDGSQHGERDGLERPVDLGVEPSRPADQGAEERRDVQFGGERGRTQRQEDERREVADGQPRRVRA
jgi:hypothetical protein